MKAGNAAAALVERVVRNPVHYWAAMVFDVCAALVFLVIGTRQLTGSWSLGVVAVLVGFVGWGLLEYALHRWVLHGPPSIARINHAHHHADPTVLIGTPICTIMLGATAVWLLLALVIPSGVAALVVFGLYGGYNHFAIFHHLGHHHADQLARVSSFQRLERFHEAHHARQNMNFGITTTFWDRLFGTFDPSLKT